MNRRPVVAVTQRIVKRGHEEGDFLDHAWLHLHALRRALIVPIPNSVDHALAVVNAVKPDVVVFTGGEDLGGIGGVPCRPTSSRDLVEAALLQELPGVAMVGICRGAQLLAVDAGAKLVDSRESHAGVEHEIHLDGNSPISRGLPTTTIVASHHVWAIDPVRGADLSAIGWAPDGSLEAYVHRSLPRVGLMWHPERPQASRVGEVLLRRAIEHLSAVM